MIGKRTTKISVFGLGGNGMGESFNEWRRRFTEGLRPTIHAETIKPKALANPVRDRLSAAVKTLSVRWTGVTGAITGIPSGLASKLRISGLTRHFRRSPSGGPSHSQEPQEPKPTPTTASAPEAAAGPASPSLGSVLRGWRIAGWAVITVFMGGSVLWAANTQLDSAAIAHGVVSVESSSKTIQHLEGGIIKAIMVKDGERVEAGQVLVRFDDTYARASLDLLEGQLAGALALHARLIAEREGHPEIVFSDELLDKAGDSSVSELMIGQVDIFESHKNRTNQQDSILRERIKKNRSEINGLQAQVGASNKQLALLNEEIESAMGLLERGLERKSRVLALKRKSAEISGDIGDFTAQIARVGEGISELQLQLTLLRSRSHNQVTEQMQDVQAHIANLREKIFAARDVLRRTQVPAPQSGTVVDLQVHTSGGVVQPGQRLMSLVPDQDRLIVDVRVDPRDIDAVYIGMPARMRLTAFNARTTPALDGHVTSVSADRVTDPITGIAYFSARVVPEEKAMQNVQMASLTPGMQAEVFLVTAERTALDFMFEPVARSMRRAGREQ